MYQIQFLATDDADWTEAVELIDDDTNGPLADATDASFDLQVTDCGSAVLSASTDDGTLLKPDNNMVAWTFTKAQLGSLCRQTTYRCGLTMTTAGGTTQLFVGTLAFIDGGLSP